jgi:type IX secretion system PorP/SprF family membrane protein
VRHIFCLTITITCFAGLSYSQQSQPYTVFWNNYSIYNPAASGLSGKHFASLNANTQSWLAASASVLYDVKFKPLHGGLGINYDLHREGRINSHNVNGNYAFQLDLARDKVLSVGMGFSLYNRRYPVSSGFQSESVFDLNAGAAYKTRHWLVGLSATKLIQSAYKVSSLKNIRHYYLLCSYHRPVGRNFEIKPSVFVKTEFSHIQADFNFIATYKERFWFGGTYRIYESIALMAGVDIMGSYRIAYAYDFNIAYKLYMRGGSHEIALAFMFD